MSATTAPRLSVVVPLHNEEGNVSRLLEATKAVLQGLDLDFEIIFVDDGSTDGSVAEISVGKGVRLIAFPRRRGQSAAIYEGIMEAKGIIIATMDGDCQNDPQDIPRLIEMMDSDEGLDLLCGFRAPRRDGVSRRWQSWLANRFRRAVLRDGVGDAGCGLKLMRSECRDALVYFNGMHRFLPALLAGAGYRVGEAPVRHRARQFGKSKYRLGHRFRRASVDLWGVWWLLRRRRDWVLARSQTREAPHGALD